MAKYDSINELAKKYALTNDQLESYLRLNNVNVDDYLKVNLNSKRVKELLERIVANDENKNHQNNTSLEYIRIEGLFGKYNYSIDFDSDIFIWVSENGIGKTTILKIIVSILNGDQKTLMNMDFKKIYIKLSGKEYVIDKEQYFHVDNNSKTKRIIESMLIDLSVYIPKNDFSKIMYNFVNNGYIDFDTLNLCLLNISDAANKDQKNRILFLIEELKEIQFKSLSKILYDIEKNLSEDVLFYPTYRRVEVGIDQVFYNFQDSYNKFAFTPRYMGFGMNDVKIRINNLLDKIRDDANTAYINMNANIINELLNEDISNYINHISINMHEVDVMINRIGKDKIDTDALKKFILTFTNGESTPNNYFLLYYLQKLIKIYDSQRALDKKLKKFAKVCNKYLSGKSIVYDDILLTMSVYDFDGRVIDFENLSSGEKQIVSIFSKVYLDVVSRCIFIIDEPEISISIEWQKELLKDIYESGKIGLLIATTHSPFIFKNNYREFVNELDIYKKA